MSREIDLTINGGFPATQNSLDFLQKKTQEILKAYYSNLGIEDIGNYILGGAVVNGLNISKGVLIVNGQYLELMAGNGSYVSIEQVQTTVTYGDNNNQTPYTHKWAEITTVSAGNIPIADFQRLSQYKTITASDCTHLALRTYTYTLPKFVTTIELDATGNTTGGFILNKIIPFDGIPNGYQLMVKMLGGTAITHLTKNNVDTNFYFNRNETNDLGDVVLTPYFSVGKFIGSTNSVNAGGGYAKNLNVLFSWSSNLKKWIEISRTSGQSI